MRASLKAPVAWSQYAEFRRTAMELAREKGWEGDIRRGENGPCVTALPFVDPEEYGKAYHIIAWKQDNNGQTFVASPQQLPWLVHRRQQRRARAHW